MAAIHHQDKSGCPLAEELMAEDIQLEGTWKLAKTSVLTLHIDQESIDWVQKQYDGGETELTINFPEDKTVLVLHFAVPPQRRIKTP